MSVRELAGVTLVLTASLLALTSSAAEPWEAGERLRPAVAMFADFQLAQRWEELSPDDRERALRNYRRYQELPAEKRKDVDKSYEKWKSLPNTDRDRYRRKYEDYRGRGVLDD